MKKYSFAPISNPAARILILGTMPGEKSLRLNQYYGHGGNQFWKLIFSVFGKPFSDNYEQRMRILLENHIALWDALKVCEREGSADNDIIQEESNDFIKFLGKHPKIQLIAFNGKKAEDYFTLYYKHKLNIPKITLPSTSSANTWKTFDEKLSEWQVIKLP
jgi:hypoxanthine-DNA glycosylase